MAYTAMEQVRLKEAAGQSRAGRKLEKPVFAYSLAWHPEQEPDQKHMLDTARKSLRMMGLEDHEALIVAHQDEPQKHVHVIVNRVHPITGRAGDVRNSKRKFSDFSHEYELEHGKIYCLQREQNKQIQQLAENTKNPSIWRRITGGARRDKQDLRTAVKSYKNARGRYTEKIGGIKSEHTRTADALGLRQATERQELRDHIDHQREVGDYGQTQKKQRTKERTRKHQKDLKNRPDRGRDGMSM
jgi:hypothetical protein